ncbi:DUF3939 domain-containing protein [Gracilibacillus massiliensis]|uniref:DUF3939 domain-containing protein n=1 Tax=Gracilibacillus massiliensis TaxID=1564956 RepID=UPI00071CD1B8|nr:DUF3939 domain-containing protein [Gracilibacillus massiliensis]
MWFKKKAKEAKIFPVRDVSFEEIQSAIHQYSQDLPPNIPLKILVKDDLSLDYTLLAPILKANPEKTYYMSKETYDLFEEKDKHIAYALDTVQRAVDNYIAQKKELPIIDYDPYRKVSFHKLEQLKLIDKRPEMDFYITDEEQLVTTIKPK